MRLYDNGETILKASIEQEDWYNFYHDLMEITCYTEFEFSYIDDPDRLVVLFDGEYGSLKDNKHYKNCFPSKEQVLRWAVLLAERHNNAYNCPDIVNPWREEYSSLKETLKDWTDIDIAMLEIALVAKKTGFPEFFKDVKKGGLPKNKFWIYNNDNPLSIEIIRLLEGLTTFGILEQNPDSEESQWRWKVRKNNAKHN